MASDLPIDPERSAAGAPVFARPCPPACPRARPEVLGVIGAGGLLGTLARYEVSLAWPVAKGHFPAATFTINTSGAFAIGLLLVIILERSSGEARYLRPFLTVGVLGGWTTMSTLAVEGVTLVDGGHWTIAAGYLIASLIAGIAAAAAGMALGRHAFPHRHTSTTAR